MTKISSGSRAATPPSATQVSRGEASQTTQAQETKEARASHGLPVDTYEKAKPVPAGLASSGPQSSTAEAQVLEATASRYEKLKSHFTPEAQGKIKEASRVMITAEAAGTAGADIEEQARDLVAKRFPSVSPEAEDVFTFGVLAQTENPYDTSGQGQVTIGGLKSLLDDMKGKLDGMNEMSEMTSLRLQMTMDRRSKFISTLSSLMKKISTTQDTIVQNIK